MARSVFAFALLLAVACTHPTPPPQQTVQVMPSRAVRARLLPNASIRPARPNQGLDGSMGYVVVEYDLDRRGRVIRPRVVFAHPPDMYDAVALERIRGMRFDPVPGRRFGLRTKFAMFTEPNGRTAVSAAFVRCRGLPYVVVEFDVGPSGAPEMAKVVEACPRGVYDALAVKMVERRRFDPTPVPRRGLRTRLTFGEKQD